MGVSKNRGTPKSSILIGFSIINHPFWGYPLFLETSIYVSPKETPQKKIRSAEKLTVRWVSDLSDNFKSTLCLPSNFHKNQPSSQALGFFKVKVTRAIEKPHKVCL